jgi:lipid A 3-O-deacylase
VSFRPLVHCARGGLLIIALGGLGSRFAFAQSPAAAPPHLGETQAAGGAVSHLDLGMGAFDIQGDRGVHPSPVGQIEFRYGRKLFSVGPAVGILANTRGAIFGYGGLYADFRVGRFVVTPLGAVGGYRRSGGEDLGGTFQFGASVEFSYQFDNQSRLGAQVAHISNGGTGRRNLNPGPNELLLTYAIPLHLP